MSSRRDRKNAQQVSLSDLLSDQEAGPAGDEPRPISRRWWITDIVVSALVAGGAYVVLRVMQFVSPLPVLFAVTFALILLRRALRSVPPEPLPPATRSDLWGVTDDGAEPGPPADGVVRAVQRWESRFGWTERDPARYRTAVQPRLYELVDERLRQRHGITMQSEPERARALIGEQLWTFLHARVARTPNSREMAAVVDEMEKI